jgi:hypothetical protein
VTTKLDKTVNDSKATELLEKSMRNLLTLIPSRSAEEDDDDPAPHRGTRSAPPRACAIDDPCTGELIERFVR